MSTPNHTLEEPALIQAPNNIELQENVNANRVALPNMGNTTQQTEQTQPTQPTQPTQATTQTKRTPSTTAMNVANNMAQQMQPQNQQVQPLDTLRVSVLPNQSISQPSGATVAVKTPTDLNDATVQGYLNDYQNGININDYQAQINALTAIDNYRATKGLKPIYTTNILELTNQRTAKIENAIKDYENDIAQAVNAGEYDLAEQIGRQLEDYKKMVNYKSSVQNAADFLQQVEYKSRWDNTINDIIGQLLTAKFTYDPKDDEALIKAQQYATNVVYESMNARGILDSTMTTQMVTKTVNELIPVYQKMAKEEFYENIERLQTMANFIIKLDDRDYSRWEDEVTRQLQVYQARKDETSYQWNRVNTIGYVDNEASIVLGVPVGTLSPNKRQAISEAQAEIEKEYRKLESDIYLAQAKAEIDYQYDVAKSQTKAGINVSEYAQKQAIKSAYEGTNNTTNDESVQQGQKYQGTISNITKTIKNNYDRTGDLATAIQDIYTNFTKNADRAAAFDEILGMTEEEAIDSYNDSIIDTIISSLEEKYGSISKNNREKMELEIVNAVDTQGLSKDIAEKALEEIEYEINYQDELKRLQKIQQDEVNLINSTKDTLWINNLKNAMEKTTLAKASDSVKEAESILTEKLGTERYQRLLEEIQNKDNEISATLKKRGIDW